MFRGHFVHAIDAKGRMSIPAGFRTELQSRSDQAPILTISEESLLLYPYDDWCAFEDQILGLSAVQPDVQDYQRYMIANCAECPIDRQGRILIPTYMREHAQLEREVTVAGIGPRVELWDKARFDAKMKNIQARHREIASAVAKLDT